MVKRPGFTLIELLVVMAIIATLLALVLPRYYGSVKRAEEATLKQNLALMRDALDKHFADTGRYPTGAVRDVGGCAGRAGEQALLARHPARPGDRRQGQLGRHAAA